MPHRSRRLLALAGVATLMACGCGSRPVVPVYRPWALSTPAAWRPNAGPLWRPAFPPPYAPRAPGEDAWQLGNYAQAVALEDAAIRDAEARHAPPQAIDYVIRADSEAATRHLGAAWADFRQAIRLDPHQELAYIRFGIWLDRAHRPAQGVAVLIQATRALPRSAGCWGLLGWLQYQAGQFEASLASSRHSEALDGSKSYVRYNQGLCRAALGDWPQAAAAYRRALGRGTDEDRQLALMEIRNALRKQPRSAVLRRAEQMLADGAGGVRYEEGNGRPRFPGR